MADNDKLNHLEYFKISNFKCFEELELKSLGLFNLILGDNNVGKTSLLESLLFQNKVEDYLSKLYFILTNRYGLTIPFPFSNEVLRLFFKDNNSDLTINTEYKIFNEKGKHKTELSLLKKEELSKEEVNSISEKLFTEFSKISNHIVKLKSDQEINYLNLPSSSTKIITSQNNYCPFIYLTNKYKTDLVEFYTENIQISKTGKTNFIKDLSFIVPNIEDVEISKDIISNNFIFTIREYKSDFLKPLPNYGEGTVIVVRILLEIASCKNKFLMVDEIDSGIHYSKFKNYWKTILKAAQRNNTQLFMTTHSLECLKYLKEVLEEREMEEFRNKTVAYSLEKLSDNKTKAYRYPFEDFEHALKQGIEIRGGK
ncbi:MAG: AAA family ATPase [Ignavibacteria bacterium]|nr:AAA family ATPase [Ignavibacteria bacterium]